MALLKYLFCYLQFLHYYLYPFSYASRWCFFFYSFSFSSICCLLYTDDLSSPSHLLLITLSIYLILLFNLPPILPLNPVPCPHPLIHPLSLLNINIQDFSSSFIFLGSFIYFCLYSFGIVCFHFQVHLLHMLFKIHTLTRVFFYSV